MCLNIVICSMFLFSLRSHSKVNLHFFQFVRFWVNSSDTFAYMQNATRESEEIKCSALHRKYQLVSMDYWSTYAVFLCVCKGRDYQNVIRASKALSQNKKKHECCALRLAIVSNQVLTSLCSVLKPEIHVNDTLCGTLTKRPRCGTRFVFWLHVFVVMPVSKQQQQQLHAAHNFHE